MSEQWPEWDSETGNWSPQIIEYVSESGPFSEGTTVQGNVNPDWDKWRTAETVSIREAVLLALGLNPKVFLSFSWESAPKVVNDLLDISSTWTSLHQPQAGYQMVKLSDFLKLAKLVSSEPMFQAAISSCKLGSDDVTISDILNMPPKLKELFPIMRAIAAKARHVNPVEIVIEMTDRKKRESSVIASLINPNPIKRAERGKGQRKIEPKDGTKGTELGA